MSRGVLGREARQPGLPPELRPQARATRGAATAQRLPRMVTTGAGHPCATAWQSRTSQPELGRGLMGGLASDPRHGYLCVGEGRWR